MQTYRISPRLVAALAITALPAAAGVEDPHAKAVAASNARFAFDLYDVLRQDAGANIFISPAGISTALAMTYAGARGETAAEMRAALRWTLDDDDLHPAIAGLADALAQKRKGYLLTLANALWGQQGWPFEKDFTTLTRQHYGAGFREVDFARSPEQARTRINDWIEKKTQHRIRELLRPTDIGSATVLVLTNAMHFRGLWEHPFNPKETRREIFHAARDKQVPVDMMRFLGGSFRYLREGGFEALELPYAGGEASMTIFLPDRGTSLEKFEERLAPKQLEAWVSGMRPAKMAVVAIPRLDLVCRYELPDALRQLGMRLAFTSNADFSGITPRSLWIDNVIHETFLQVAEHGTEAAAASAVVQKKFAVFQADRPFFFVIRDHATGAVLFMGRFVNPQSAGAPPEAED